MKERKTDNRQLKTEDRRQNTGDRIQETEYRRQNTESSHPRWGSVIAGNVFKNKNHKVSFP